MLHKKVGLSIQLIRKKRGLSQEEVAEKTGMSTQHIAFIEQGRREPKIRTLEKIANVLEVGIRDFF